jgi:hypothetical protein
MRRTPFGLLLTLSARSLWAHKVKSFVVGSILVFGTVLVVLGTALLGTLEGTMTRSITSSMAGDIQLYSSAAKDDLQLFGSMGMGSPDYGDIDSPELLAPIAALDNVKDVVPMGITLATVFGPSQLDRVLEELRIAVRSGDEDTVLNVVPQLRRIARSLRENRVGAEALVADHEKLLREVRLLERVDTDEFWEVEFETDRLATVELLEQQVAPLAEDGKMLFLQTVGTDLEQFARTFDRFRVVEGQRIPPGRRGILLSKRIYERDVKNLVARELDVVWEHVQGGEAIADDPLLQETIRRNSRQYARITFGLSARDAVRLEQALRSLLPDVDGGLDALVERFLLVDDTTIEARHRFFYEVVAPMIQLYDFPVGSTMPLRAYTKSGYVRSIEVPIYGTYEFEGLETSDIAAASNLTDLVTFRELFGKMTDAQQAELAAIRADVGVVDVSRESAEAALFGGSTTIEAEAAGRSDALAALETTRFRVADSTADRVFSPDEMRNGLFVNAAVVLDDPSRLDDTLATIRRTIAERGLPIQAVDWRAAAGVVGQFLWVVRGILVIMMTIIFLVALLIINNSMVVATLERVGEIGTMRAIGARRGLVVSMFMGETALLGLASGAVGVVLSLLALAFLRTHGIPATHDVLVLLFAGPRLYPEPTWGSVVFGLVTVVGIGVVSTFYPALLAAWVPPVTAMRAKE